MTNAFKPVVAALLLAAIWLVGLAADVNASAPMHYKEYKTFGRTGRGRDQLKWPSAIAVSDDDQVFVADRDNNTIVLYDRRWKWVKSVGRPKGGGKVRLKEPSAMVIDSAGRVIVADTGNDRVVIFDRNAAFVDQIGGFGVAKGSLRQPRDIAVGERDRIYVADTGNERIQVFSKRGRLEDVWRRAGRGVNKIKRPSVISYTDEKDGFILFVNEGEGVIERLELDGDWDSTFEVDQLVDGAVVIADMAVDDRFGRIVVLDSLANRFIVLSWQGKLLAEIDLPVLAVASSLDVMENMNVLLTDVARRQILVYDRVYDDR